MSVVKTAALIGNTDGIIEAETWWSNNVVTNTGNVTIKGVELTDTLTDGNGNQLSLTQDSSIDGIVRDIAPGASESYVVTYIIEQDAADSGSIINTATATGSDPNGNPVIVISDGDTDAVDGDEDGNFENDQP